jgi:hypothetical protein
MVRIQNSGPVGPTKLNLTEREVPVFPHISINSDSTVQYGRIPWTVRPGAHCDTKWDHESMLQLYDAL